MAVLVTIGMKTRAARCWRRCGIEGGEGGAGYGGGAQGRTGWVRGLPERNAGSLTMGNETGWVRCVCMWVSVWRACSVCVVCVCVRDERVREGGGGGSGLEGGGGYRGR